MKKERGITLIALVITIIVLLILAGVTISLIIGQNGIVKQSTRAKESYKEAEERERLELVMQELAIDKKTKKDYNENEYINDKILKQEMYINEDIVTVEEYQFLIDRTVPKILQNLGKGNREPNIQIQLNSQIGEGKETATITITVVYENEIEEIKMNGQILEVPQKTDGKYELTSIANSNGSYYIHVKDKEGKYQYKTIQITGLGEDLVIKTVEDLKTFRDNVNNGVTYKGKTITLMNDIDLQEIENWIPIGQYNKNCFEGIFEGNHKTIKNLSINADMNEVGLFGWLYGEVRNVTIEKATIKGTYWVGTICGVLSGEGAVENCIVKEDSLIQAQSNHENSAGGIVGLCYQKGTQNIRKCVNKANIIAKTTGQEYTLAGGIVGNCDTSLGNYAVIEECYNIGNILTYSESTTIHKSAYTGGIAGQLYGAGALINKCYNKGEISSQGRSDYPVTGGVAGVAQKGAKIQNTYNLGAVSYSVINNESITTGVGGIVGGLNDQDTVLENSYNMGIVKSFSSGTNRLGAVVGAININTAIKNCYSGSNVGTSNLYGWNYEVDNVINCEMKSNEEIKLLAGVLGEEFIEDRNNDNNGYPILRWQI